MSEAERNSRGKSWLGPAITLVVGLVSWGRFWAFIGVVDTLGFLAEQLSRLFVVWPAVSDFVAQDGGLIFIAIALAWAAVILIKRHRIGVSIVLCIVALIAGGFWSFRLGQQWPSIAYLQNYYDAIRNIDVGTDPASVKLEINTLMLDRFRESHMIGARCRSKTPGVQYSDDRTMQTSNFYGLSRPLSIELVLGEPIQEGLCRVQEVECGVLLLKRDEAERINRIFASPPTVGRIERVISQTEFVVDWEPRQITVSNDVAHAFNVLKARTFPRSALECQ